MTALGGSPAVSDHEWALWAKAVEGATGSYPSRNLLVWHLIRALSIHYGGAEHGTEVVLLRSIIDSLGGSWDAAQDKPVLIQQIADVI